MTDELETRIRARLRGATLPGAPDVLRAFVGELPRLPAQRTGRPALRLLAVAALLLVGGAAYVIGSGQPPSDSTALPSLPPSSSSDQPTPASTERVYTVSEAIAARDAGELGSRSLLVSGYWTDRRTAHMCSAPSGPVGELEIRCSDGEFGVTELPVAIREILSGGRYVDTDTPKLTPWFGDPFNGGSVGPIETTGLPPIPILLRGHFDDPLAEECNPARLQLCRERFVVDEIVEFDPGLAVAVTPSPAPTPFPSPPPPAPFEAAACGTEFDESDGIAFAGWTTDDDVGIDIGYEGHIYAVVLEGVPVSDWRTDDATGERYRIWSGWVCFQEDFRLGSPGNNMIGMSAGSQFRVYEDGRREAGQ